MDTRDSDDRRRTGAVKAAVNMFGERTTSKKPHTEVVIKPFNFCKLNSSTVHMAKRDIARYRERRRSAEFVNVQAEAELSQAKRAVKVLASQIEESNAKFMAKKKETEESLMTNSKIDDAGSSGGQKSDRYLEVMKELEFVKSELSKLKLGMASVLEEKAQAEKVANNSQFTQQSETDTVEALRKEIDEANEEHVLVELATIEALKEKEEIEAQRQKESSEFSAAVEEKRKKMNEAIEEIDSSKEMESKLAVTLFDAGVLHNELRLAKEMEMKIQRSNSMRSSGSVSRRIEQGSEGSPMLKSIKNELEAAKKELATVKEEGFQFMASMDIIRNELQHVKEEAARLEKEEEKADVTVQNLNSKLLRGKSKLDAAISAEEKAKSILSNLNLTLEQLMTEAEVAKKEKELIGEETTNIKVEIHKTETEIDITEEKLEAAMEELEQIKVSEALAMRKLQDLIENAMRARASASEEGCSTINLSRFEYEYLTGRAGKAEEIADKKVAAAQAWIEALNASEKEILMKVEMAHREIREMKVEEEREALGAAERSKRTAGEGGGGGGGHRQSKGRKKSVSETPRKPHRTSSSGNLTPTRRLKLRNTEFTPSRTTPRSVSVPIKKRKASVPNLSKMLMWQEK
ncbi:Protein PLASTID MOVEMENT IMPAIRED 2 [Linum perenne]